MTLQHQYEKVNVGMGKVHLSMDEDMGNMEPPNAIVNG